MREMKKYRQKKPDITGGMKKSLYFLLLMVWLLSFSGCVKKQDFEEAISVKDTTQTVATQEAEKQEEPVRGIADGDWEIKNYPVAGTDNLYELDIKELTKEAAWISAVKAYGDKLLVLSEAETGETNLYMLNPLTVEIAASLKLPAGGYYADGMQIREDGSIQLYNMKEKEIYFYNSALQEENRISIGDFKTNHVLLTPDEKYMYYVNYEDNGIYRYHTEEGTAVRVLDDVKCDAVLQLLKEDTCLLFQYYDEAVMENIYEIRNINTGECLYKDSAELWGIQTVDQEYTARHYEDGLLEIIYGSKTEKKPKVLSLKSYEEYNCADICLDSHSVVSSTIKKDAEKAYDILVGEGKAEPLAGENQTVTLLNMNQYNLKSGQRQYTMDFYYVHDKETSLYGCTGIYLQDAGCIVCYIEGAEKRWLVWDVTKDSSSAQDETDYLYNWQDSENPDTEALKSLRARAKQIGDKNGVDIRLGADVLQCPKDIYDYKVSNNVIRIEKMLSLLEKALSKYPEGMLAQLEKNGNSRIQIYLAGGIVPTDETGIESIGIQNTIHGVIFLVLDINQFNDLENTIYHEIFHAVEQFLNQDEEAFFDYEVWNTLNPEDFEYDYNYQLTGNDNYAYTVEDIDREVYFVDCYSKSFPSEDRARIMEFAMLDDGDARRKKVIGAGIQRKLGYISEQIRKGFNTTGWPERTSWEEVLQ